MCYIFTCILKTCHSIGSFFITVCLVLIALITEISDARSIKKSAARRSNQDKMVQKWVKKGRNFLTRLLRDLKAVNRIVEANHGPHMSDPSGMLTVTANCLTSSNRHLLNLALSVNERLRAVHDDYVSLNHSGETLHLSSACLINNKSDLMSLYIHICLPLIIIVP